MILLSIILIIGVLLIILRNGFNAYVIVGAIVGLFIGSSLGIAGGGTAVNGIFIFGGIGLIIGGLVKPGGKGVTEKKKNVKYSSYSKKKSTSQVQTEVNLGNFKELLKKRKSSDLAGKIFKYEKSGSREDSLLLLEKVKEFDAGLYYEVLEQLKAIRLKYYLK